MSVLQQKQQLFDRWAPTYDWIVPGLFYQAAHQQMMDHVTLPAHAQVLDIGCGTGRLLNRLAARFPDLQGTGMDFSAEMLRQARRSNRHRPRLIFVQGPAAPLRFAPEQFDAVFNSFSFMHYPEPDRVFAEVYRVLRPGGQFYLADPAVGFWNAQRDRDRQTVPMSPGGVKFYSPTAREALGQAAGLSCIAHHRLMGLALLSIFVKSNPRMP